MKFETGQYIKYMQIIAKNLSCYYRLKLLYIDSRGAGAISIQP